jgi:hypothetical protein
MGRDLDLELAVHSHNKAKQRNWKKPQPQSPPNRSIISLMHVFLSFSVYSD